MKVHELMKFFFDHPEATELEIVLDGLDGADTIERAVVCKQFIATPEVWRCPSCDSHHDHGPRVTLIMEM